MQKFEYFIYNFLLTLSLNIIILFIGQILFSILRNQGNNKWLNLFTRLVLGSILLVTIQSIIATKGNTIYLFSIPILIYFIYLNKLNLISSSKQYLTNLYRTINLILSKKFLITQIFTAFFILLAVNEHYLEGYGLVSLPDDINYYGRLSSYLNNFGIENSNLNPDITNSTPYHYFELWLNIALTTLRETNNYFTFTLNTIPLLIGMLFTGINSIIELNNENKIPGKRYIPIPILGLLLVFFTGYKFGYNFPLPAFLGAADYFTLNLNFPKLITITIFCIACYILFKKNKYGECIALLAFIPWITVTAAPTIYIFISILILKESIDKKFTWSLIIKKYSIPTLILSLYLSYYIINILWFSNSHTKEPFEFSKIIELAKIPFKVQFVLTAINIYIGTIVSILFLYLPLLFWLCFNLKLLKLFIEENKKGLIIFCAINFCALTSWSLFHKMIDSIQFFQIIIVPTILILTINVIHYIIFNSNKLSSNITIFFLLVSSLFTIKSFIAKTTNIPTQRSTYFLKSVSNYFNNTNSFLKGGLINNTNNFNSIFYKNLDIQLPGMAYVAGMSNNSSVISLSILDIKRSPVGTPDYKGEESIIKNSPFFLFTQSQEQSNDREENIINYIKEKDLNFLILDDKDFLIQKYYPNAIIIKDKPSNHSFIILKD